MLEEEVYSANSPIWDVDFAQNAVPGSVNSGAGESAADDIYTVNRFSSCVYVIFVLFICANCKQRTILITS